MMLWLRVRDFATRRIRARHLKKYSHDRRCSCCDSWGSETGGILDYVDTYDRDGHEFTRCRKCKQWTRWDCRSGFIACLADKQPELRRENNDVPLMVEE